MRVTVRFVDGEELRGTAESVTLDGGGFTLVGTGGNTRSIWVGPGAIKYVMVEPARNRTTAGGDPRATRELPKLVLHFLDGEVLRTYRDRFFAPQPGGFAMRLWDGQTRQLVRAIVAGASLKGIFTVDEWDSRPPQEKRTSEGEPDAGESTELPHPDPEAAVGVEEARIQEPAPVREPPAAAAAPAPEIAEPAFVVLATAAEATAAPPAATEVLPVDADDGPAANVGIIVRGDTEERRPTFHSGLGRRAKLAQTMSPEEERHFQLMARISEVLGTMGPMRDEAEDEGPS